VRVASKGQEFKCLVAIGLPKGDPDVGYHRGCDRVGVERVGMKIDECAPLQQSASSGAGDLEQAIGAR
jgi:hypothetical protein